MFGALLFFSLILAAIMYGVNYSIHKDNLFIYFLGFILFFLGLFVWDALVMTMQNLDLSMPDYMWDLPYVIFLATTVYIGSKSQS